MMWRALVLFDVLSVAAYVYRMWGETAAWASIAAMGALLLPLGAIERRLAEIAKGLSSQNGATEGLPTRRWYAKD